MVDLPDSETVKRRAAEIGERIEAARPSGAKPVTLVAVTKAFPVKLVATALAAGLVDIGENYAQELEAKAVDLAALDPTGAGGAPRWHFIGGLQRNKVKLIAGRVHLWQTVDRRSLVDEIARRAPGARVLVQVNTTGEPQKGGCEPEATGALVDGAREAGLDVRGLMTVGPTSPAADPRPSFELLRDLADRSRLAELSMGMSGDFELAVREGATMVRVGSALFGSRPAVTGRTAKE
jgi:pyridoxal phosphate enzyme (YggS family)